MPRVACPVIGVSRLRHGATCAEETTVQASNGVRTRLVGSPMKLRYVWADVRHVRPDQGPFGGAATLRRPKPRRPAPRRTKRPPRRNRPAFGAPPADAYWGGRPLVLPAAHRRAVCPTGTGYGHQPSHRSDQGCWAPPAQYGRCDRLTTRGGDVRVAHARIP